jgi:hypothetical protein
VASIAGDVQGTACLAPANNPCQTFYVVMKALSLLRLENVSGSQRAILVGQSFQPVVVRVTDSASPPNPVVGASVLFQSMMFLPSADEPVENEGESSSSNHAMEVLLGSSQKTTVSDVNGLALVVPTAGGLNRPSQVEITASAGAGAQLQFELQALPPFTQPSLDGSAASIVISLPNRTLQGPAVVNEDPDCPDGADDCERPGVGGKPVRKAPLIW